VWAIHDVIQEVVRRSRVVADGQPCEVPHSTRPSSAG
jgi:hypothetical protein